MSDKKTTEPRFVGSEPGAPPDLKAVVSRAYGGAADKWHARFGFAYVSESGLEVLLDVLDGVEGWGSTQKRWILGVHHGITEPTAIAKIHSLENSEARLFTGNDRLTKDSLVIGSKFHAKVLCIQGRQSKLTKCLVASSANLTGAAFGTNARNYEAGIVLSENSIDKSSISKFDRWWQSAWQASIGVSDNVIDRYAKLRDAFFRRNPDTLSDLDPPSLDNLTAAATLWIESGAMSGGSRNQVEFNHELAGFFGPIERQSHPLRIRANNREWDDRPLSHKVTTFGVDIWRLSLPTESTGGFVYPGKVIRFQRRRDRNGSYFDVSVAERGSRGHVRWRSEAHRRGHVGLTIGHRAFGFF